MFSRTSSFLPVPKEDFNTIKDSTKFTRGEIEYLYTRFRTLGEPKGRVSFLLKRDFDFPSHALHSLILSEMFGSKNQINFVEFAKFLYIFRAFDSKTSKEEQTAIQTKKLKLLFSMYDVNKDGSISKQDLLDIVHRLYSNYTNIQTMVRIVHIVMKEMDNSNTNQILFNDFCKALEVFDMDNLVVKFPTL
ncbi:calcineurin subunit B type 1 [Episyrphus balteatus]|uniref:calcineurin subunit B type 1 n=1 Tax=Episyrphus balteatus TaxID=286459 RepID=UPI0024862DFB|nr:calcineurin subunit B type 1 [Episyrphus balteatus]